MTARIIPKRSNTSGVIPDSIVLDIGELAVNAVDGIIFTKLPDGNVVNLSGAPELHNHQISQIIGLQDELDSKVDVVAGKQLSTEDYTTTEKNKLAGIEPGADVNVATNLGQSRNATSYTVTSSTGTNTTLQASTTSVAGVMSANDKAKLNGIEAGAEVNVVDSVNAQTGAIVLDSDDIDEGTGNLYYTDLRATTAIKNDADWNAGNWDTAFGWGDHSLAGYESQSNKGVANGYAGLDSGGKVPASQLPSFVDDVLEFATEANFPATGETGKLYIALDTNEVYRWSGSTYIAVSSSSVSSVNGQEGAVVLTTTNINEGTNLYYTDARARNAISVSGDLSYNAGVISFSETYSTPTELLNAIKTVDGAGSGLDADTLDGITSASFLRSNAADTVTGDLSFNADIFFDSIGHAMYFDRDTAARNHIGFTLNGVNEWFLNVESGGDFNIENTNGVGDLTVDGSVVWNAGNDGTASGLDADLLDGQHGAFYQNATNLNAGTVNAARLPAEALVGDTTYTAGTGITLNGTTFSLSDERYTLTEKNKLAGIQAGAETNLVDSVNNKTGNVVINATDVGLGNVRNVASYSQVEADGRFVNDDGDALTGIYTINTSDDGGNDLQVGGNVSLRGQTGLGTETPTETLDANGNIRIRDTYALKFGGTTGSDSKARMEYNESSQSFEFNFS